MEEANGKSFKMFKTVMHMMVNIKMTKRMVMVYSLGKVVTFIKAIIKMMKEMVMEKCFGLMVHIIKVNGEKEFSMVKVR